jgi:pimeloyl-ACP methyl ester carboxylesterase
MTRWLTVALAAVLALGSFTPPVDGGGVPDRPPPDWVVASPGPGAEITRFVLTLPQDPNPLGVPAAHLRTKTYPQNLSATTLRALDGTLLAGRWALIHDGRPRPGVVLVPGSTQSKDLKFMVELAELFWRNGWHVLAVDLRGNGESRRLSQAMYTGGWKEADDVLGAVRHLRETSKASSVAVIGFSLGGTALVKAMAADPSAIGAGVAVTPALGRRAPLTPTPPDYRPSPGARWVLDHYGARSFYEYFERAARSYGVDLATLEAGMRAERDVARVGAPLLLIHALDDFFWRNAIRSGDHDGGTMNLAYRDTVKDHPHVRTMVVDRGNHAGMLYLSDPHWFGLVVLSYLKHWLARDAAHVTASVPSLDVLAEATLSGPTATYRFVVRNHGARSVGPLDVHLVLPEGGRAGHCWVGFEGLGRCTRDGRRLTWTIPRLAGGKTTAGPFTAVVDVSSLSPGEFAATVEVEQTGVLAQDVTLQKP